MGGWVGGTPHRRAAGGRRYLRLQVGFLPVQPRQRWALRGAGAAAADAVTNSPPSLRRAPARRNTGMGRGGRFSLAGLRVGAGTRGEHPPPLPSALTCAPQTLPLSCPPLSLFPPTPRSGKVGAASRGAHAAAAAAAGCGGAAATATRVRGASAPARIPARAGGRPLRDTGGARPSPRPLGPPAFPPGFSSPRSPAAVPVPAAAARRRRQRSAEPCSDRAETRRGKGWVGAGGGTLPSPSSSLPSEAP